MTSITEKCTEALADLGKPFKYLGEIAGARPPRGIQLARTNVMGSLAGARSGTAEPPPRQALLRLPPRPPLRCAVTCVIMQDTGAGVSSTPVATFDGVSDGLVAITWPTEKAKETAFVYCIVTVCGMALFSR